MNINNNKISHGGISINLSEWKFRDIGRIRGESDGVRVGVGE